MWGTKKSDQQFFKAFTQQADLAARAAGLLLELFRDPTRHELAEQIKVLEHSGDKIVHETVKALRATWITPFDRADIRTLVSQLDDVLDLLHATAQRMVLFEIRTAPKGAQALTENIVKAAAIMREGVGLLHDLKRSEEIMSFSVQIKKIEDDGDALYRELIAGLYKPGNDALEVMKLREIYENLEHALDYCEDVGDSMSGVVLEYS